MKQFRELGRDAFIAEYSAPEAAFGRSRDHFVVEDGIGYDSKPLAAAAYGFQHGRKHALHSDDFYGGPPVIRRMAALGFKVSNWTSPSLILDKIYTRNDLREKFNITDATIDNGVFRPKGTNSIWLFVTKEKTKDRTQYEDRFEGDILYWQGQSKGRTDGVIINHEDVGDELLVFFRDSKRQHPGAGFRFEGRFRYVSHSNGMPTDFILQRWTEHEQANQPEDNFDPHSVEDGRKKIWAQVRRRQGQPAFRRKLLRAYGGRCAITRCPIQALLEAAHIRPYLGAQTNVTPNGLLLRADIHTLFDLGHISIAADMSILTAAHLIGTEYEGLAKSKLSLPSLAVDYPSGNALAWHRMEHHF
ncbi:hypothetical protein DM806_02390 [Sphingobium lactosutens]|nr:hypothetical protein [Sphingobium lactosutens]